MLFPNGEFDFNTRPSGPDILLITQMALLEPRGWNSSERGIRVEHDNFGRVRRIGNVYINYDAFWKVKYWNYLYELQQVCCN